VTVVSAGAAGQAKIVTSDGSQINGGSGATGIATTAATANIGFTLVSDGTNWWTVVP
jgi:hypothetical protein